MGIAGSYCDMSFMQKYLGIRAEWVDLTEVLRRMILMKYMTRTNMKKHLQWIKSKLQRRF